MPLTKPPQRRYSGRQAAMQPPLWLVRRRRPRAWVPRSNDLLLSVTTTVQAAQPNLPGAGGTVTTTGAVAITAVTADLPVSLTTTVGVAGYSKGNTGELANGQRRGGLYCFERTTDGTLFMADGWNAMLKWDGFSYQADTVGVKAPATALGISVSGAGAILGTYWAYTRFIDKDGNPSALSPIYGNPAAPAGASTGFVTNSANPATGSIGTARNITNIQGWGVVIGEPQNTMLHVVGPGNSAQLLVTSQGHGLSDGAIIVISGVVGATEANGTFQVQLLRPLVQVPGTSTYNYGPPDPDRFLLIGGSNQNPFYVHAYVSGGSWVQLNNLSTGVSNTSPIVVTSLNHGLTTGTMVKITGVQGNDAANGIWTITVIDGNSFSLNNSNGNGTYTGGGTWTAGVSAITYSSVPTPTEAKVVRRQILRNTDGQAATFYVDIDTTDLTSTSLTSTNSDAVLLTKTAVPLFDSLGNIFANQYGIPPAHKSYLVNHQGRMYALGEVIATEGHVSVTFGSATVTGIGTNWPSSFAGRFLYVTGAPTGYQIQSVNVTAQTLTLGVPAPLQSQPGVVNAPIVGPTTVYFGPTDQFAQYAIRPAPAERKLVYFSGPFLPEAWVATNAFGIAEDDDDITGGMSMSSFMYVLEQRHIYRFTSQSNPATDGFVFLAGLRGCINDRCWVVVEDVAYMMDGQGIHKFDGGSSEPISQPIQDIFRPSLSTLHVNWAAAKYFHAAHYPGQEAIRWFVSLDGSPYPKHVIGYSYRHNRWWIEQFPWPVCSSTLWPTTTPSFLVGCEAARVMGYWRGTLDGPDPAAGKVQSAVTSATFTTLTDTAQAWPSSGVVNAPVAIVSGTGKGQVRLVRSISGNTLTLNYPWSTLPDTTSVYQLGAVQWDFQGGWFRWAVTSQEEARRVELMFEPFISAGTLDLRIYKDFAAVPQNWDTDYVSSDNDSVAVITGSPDAVVDLTKANGLVQLRIPASKDPYIKGSRFMWVELRGFSNADALRIYQMVIDAVQ